MVHLHDKHGDDTAQADETIAIEAALVTLTYTKYQLYWFATFMLLLQLYWCATCITAVLAFFFVLFVSQTFFVVNAMLVTKKHYCAGWTGVAASPGVGLVFEGILSRNKVVFH